MAQRSNLGVDRILSRFTRFLANERNQFVADSVLPTAQVRARSGKFYNLDGGFGYASPGYGLLRTSGADFRRITPDPTQVSAYEVKEYGLEGSVDDVDRELAGADALDLREAATLQTWNRAMLEREKDYAALMFNETTFSGRMTTLSGGTRWSTATGVPLDDVDTAANGIRQATGVPSSELTLLCGSEVWDSLRKNANLLDAFKYTTTGATFLAEQQVANALGIREIIVGRGVENTANEGITEVKADIWGDYALLYHKVDSPRPLAPHGLGATFALAGRAAGQVERYREEPRTEVVLVSWVEDRVITTAGAGWLIKNPAS
tara:strand:+ start:29 stop:988 length:960 start_codon:yes stop_codon:yes gene_type:complete